MSRSIITSRFTNKVDRKIWHGLIVELYENNDLEAQTFQVLIAGTPLKEMLNKLKADGVAIALYWRQSTVATMPRDDITEGSAEMVIWHKMVSLMHDCYDYETKIFNFLKNGQLLKDIIESIIHNQLEDCMEKSK